MKEIAVLILKFFLTVALLVGVFALMAAIDSYRVQFDIKTTDGQTLHCEKGGLVGERVVCR